MKKNQKIIIGIITILALGVIFLRASSPLPLSLVKGNNPVCLPQVTDTLCMNPFFDRDATGEEYLYCNLDEPGNTQFCEQVYDPQRGMLVGGCLNEEIDGEIIGRCYDETDIVDPVVCNDGDMACCYNAEDCLNLVDRVDGNSYKCVGGKWTRNQNCGERNCVRIDGSKLTECEYTKYYCTGDVTCYWSNQKLDNCYNTLDECENNLGFCCYNSNNDNYTWRLGSCENNELPRSGTGINENWCKEQNVGKCEIEKPEDCGDGVFNLCDRKECEACGFFFLDSTVGGACTLEETRFCESCSDFAISQFIGFIFKDKSCYPRAWHTYSICIFQIVQIILVPIIFIFSMLFSVDFLERFKSLKGNKNKILRILVSLIISGILAYVVYISFWIGLIVFLVYGLIKFFIRKL